jgi:hypothetical protein
MNHRLYSFVANHYLSPLQLGLQTAHAVGELSLFTKDSAQGKMYADWAMTSKTIIICGAGNQQGVIDCHNSIGDLARGLGLPCAIFREDTASMNGMATACGIILPETLWSVTSEVDENGMAVWRHISPDGMDVTDHSQNYSQEGQLISRVKQYKLA